MNKEQSQQNWTEVIEASGSWIDLRLKDVWHYRDLLRMFVKRDFIATYKQTILGPLWFFIQPILTTITFAFIFGRVAGIPTDGQPKLVFYLAGITIWNYFSDTFTKTATVFKDNAVLFGKVYFPRLLMPLSIVVSGLVRFGIQFTLFLLVLCYYIFKPGYNVQPTIYVLLTPLLVLLMAGFALGAGMIISSFTTKYRDLTFLLTFGVQLLMYATPVIYSSHSAKAQAYKHLIDLNPLSGIVETFRYAFLGGQEFSWSPLLYSSCWVVGLLLVGIIIFNKVEKTFMDTV
jgi:lipopolysaccharide transport system permease protein